MAQRPQSFVRKPVVVAPLLARRRARRAGAGTADWRAARPARPRRSTTARSAVPAPCATHTPEQAWISGSSAVTSPLAERSDDDAAIRRAIVPERLAIGEHDDRPAAVERRPASAATRSAVHGRAFGSRWPRACRLPTRSAVCAEPSRQRGRGREPSGRQGRRSTVLQGRRELATTRRSAHRARAFSLLTGCRPAGRRVNLARTARRSVGGS